MPAADDVRIGLGGPHPGIVRRTGKEFLVSFWLVLIQTPLDHVAVDVMESPRTGLLAADLLVFEITVLGEPRVFLQRSRIVAKKVGSRLARASGVLPFRLRRQPVIVACLGAEPLAILVRRVLRHTNGRVLPLAHAKRS